MKTHVQRIAFYTRKAATYSRSRGPKKARRFDRLMAYKTELNRRLHRWNDAN